MMNLIAYFRKCLDNVRFSLIPDKKHISLTRVYVTLIFFLFCYSIIAVRLFDLTVLKKIMNVWDGFNDSYTEKSAVNFDRGEILDRNGKVIALNLITTSIYANPKVIDNPESVAKKLSKIFTDIKYTELLEKLKSEKSFIWIKRNISPKEELSVNNEGIPGIYFLFGKKRAYPQGPLFSHVVGYVGLDGDGLMGAEKSFDSFLKTKDKNGKPKNLYLSLETRAQGIIRDELQKSMQEFNAVGAVGILQDVTNGEIIAMVSLPDYDPNYISQATEQELFNKATMGNYEVGSTFKFFTMTAALESGIVKMNDVYNVDAPIKTGRFSIKDFYGKKGWLSVPQILMHSSNIGISQIVLEIGKERQFNNMKTLGLLSELNIELPEKTSPVYRDLSNWSESSLITSSYGYGISVSPLHVLNAGSAVINGGRLYQPTILKDAGHQYKQVIKESTSENMRKISRMVVRFGGGKSADVDGMFVGGKSGTANKPVNGVYSDKLRISSFVSMFPMNDPKYALYIMLDEPKGNKKSLGFATGGWVAAPATAKIIRRLAPVLNIMPKIRGKEIIEESLFVQYNPNPAVS